MQWLRNVWQSRSSPGGTRHPADRRRHGLLRRRLRNHALGRGRQGRDRHRTEDQAGRQGRDGPLRRRGQGLSAINTYIGPEQDPADYARMVSNDLMGITRDDLAYDLGRHVDDSVHLFEEWGLPIWKTDADGVRHRRRRVADEGLPTLKDGGKPVRSGKWQIMINGESYKWIVAEAAKKALGHGPHPGAHLHRQAGQRQERPERASPARSASRCARTRSTSSRPRRCLLAAGGCVNVFRPRSVGEGTGRAWYPVWNAGSHLRHGCRGRRRDDHDGKPLRAGPLQGRLRPGRRLVPAVQGQGHQRLRRRLHGQEQGTARTTTRPTARRPFPRPACATT